MRRFWRLVARLAVLIAAFSAAALPTYAATEPEPKPCRDVILRPAQARTAAACAMPPPDPRPALAAGVAAGTATWFASGAVARWAGRAGPLTG